MDDPTNLRFALDLVSSDYAGFQVSMALIAHNDGIPRCVGSAFAVAPGLALTATHVVEDCVYYQRKRDGYSKADAIVNLSAIQLYGDGYLEWSIDESYASKSSDIAFLRFRRPSWWGDGPGQVKPRSVRLNLNPPRVGEAVRIFGFPNSKIKDGVLNIQPMECICRVQKVELRTANQSWNVPFAHLELEGTMEHGMSGGPCFDAEWNVVGVNSIGWQGFPSAKVALLWPAMKIEIDPFKTGAFPAIQLFSEGPAAALGYRRVLVTSEGDVKVARFLKQSTP
jgi:hypothetical protein